MKMSPALLAAASLLFAAAGARAGQCNPTLRILNSVQMLSTTDRTVMVVPVKIDNSNERLLLDTGGLVTQIGKSTAKALDLPERYRRQRLFDLTGNSSNAQTTVPKLTLGSKSESEVPMVVAPNPNLGTSLPYDGLLATDLFPGDDIDMDFGARRLTTFAPDHCAGRVIYWPADHIAVVPITVKDNLIMVPVEVDGHPLQAVLDTGSQYTVMNMAVANRLFGLTPSSPDMSAITERNGDKSITVYRHKFAELDFKGVEVKNLETYLLPNQITVHDRPHSILVTETRMPVSGARVFQSSPIDGESGAVAMPDVIIGMDMLRHLHVYFAAEEKKLYITDAVSGESALFRYKQ